MELRKEFVLLASQEGANISELCRRYGVSRKTGYKWINRYKDEGFSALTDKSRCPLNSPNRLQDSLIEKIIKIKTQYPYWGARKDKSYLRAKSGD